MKRTLLSTLVLATLTGTNIISNATAELLTTAHLADFKQGSYFIFVPRPCPDQQAYNKAIAFMDSIVKRIDGNNFKVVVVGAFYDNPTEKGYTLPAHQSDWLWVRYSDWMKQGTVIAVDEIPELRSQSDFIATPWGWLYRNGDKLWSNGIVNDADPDSLVTMATNK